MIIETIRNHIQAGRFDDAISTLAPILKLRDGRDKIEKILNTPFILARNYHMYFIELVVETGIREEKDDALLKFMLTFNADPNLHSLPFPVLVFALKARAWDFANVLLSFPYEKFSIAGSVNSQDLEGNTPLLLVYQESDTNISKETRAGLIRLLLEKGGDPFLKNNDGRSFVDCAVASKDRTIIYDIFTRYPRIKTLQRLVSYPSPFLEQLEKIRVLDLTRRAADIATARQVIGKSSPLSGQTRARKKRRIDRAIQEKIPPIPAGFKISTKTDPIIKSILALNPTVYGQLVKLMESKGRVAHG